MIKLEMITWIKIHPLEQADFISYNTDKRIYTDYGLNSMIK